MYNDKAKIPTLGTIYRRGWTIQRIHFNFAFKKATQELNHFALKEGGQINKMKALKLIYLADRYHLRKYGRLVTNDIYFAMSYGPVPSGVKDIAEGSEFLGEREKDYTPQYIITIDNLTLKSVNSVDESVFSDSDIEALDFAWEKFGHLDQFELAELTHEYPEWKKHKQTLEIDSRVQMYLEDFLEDPDAHIDKCFGLNEQDRVTRREQLVEMAHLQSLWS
jgi:uncharacterized phage-associated protein